MKKSLIALAMLGAISTIAHAQTNVTIYGVVDTGYVKQSGKDVQMGENVNNRIGFKGSEELGNGTKAIFQLEKRFYLNDGTINGVEWEGAANVGLDSNRWGKVRLGRMNEISNEYIMSQDPFGQMGIGSMIFSTQRAIRIGNNIRYDSPNMNGFSVALSYSLSKTDSHLNTNIDNDGYAVGVKYDAKPVILQASWARQADSNNSSIWNVGGSYFFGPAKLTLAYERTDNKGWLLGKQAAFKGHSTEGKQDTIFMALKWKLGPGTLLGLIDYSKLKDNVYVGNNDNSVMKYALGYTYDLSKRTSIYGQIAYSDYDSQKLSQTLKTIYSDAEKSSMGYQVGITHRF